MGRAKNQRCGPQERIPTQRYLGQTHPLHSNEDLDETLGTLQQAMYMGKYLLDCEPLLTILSDGQSLFITIDHASEAHLPP